MQYAKKVVGRKMYGGRARSCLSRWPCPGVMPVIFASAILSIPQFIQFFWNPAEGFGRAVLDAFSSSGWLYVVLYFLLILVFAYFYMSIQYNPLEMANNLRQNNGTIPGIRPGKPTADFIAKILSKVTLIGALFLAFVALIPIVYTRRDRHVRPVSGRHLRHHYRGRCSGHREAAGISDDDASLQRLSGLMETEDETL